MILTWRETIWERAQYQIEEADGRQCPWLALPKTRPNFCPHHLKEGKDRINDFYMSIMIEAEYGIKMLTDEKHFIDRAEYESLLWYPHSLIH